MMGDYLFQSEFVAKNAWRLLALQDTDVSSPSYGCFHYSFWRDKTSEFPDARFQEAGATLGILSLSTQEELLSACNAHDSKSLYQAFRAGLINLSRQQYPEGCFDEWYKGERGIAATEFTAIAYGLAAYLMGDHLQLEDRERLQDVLKKSGRWLSTRTDKIKSNHQAAIGAALALIGHVTKDKFYTQAARIAIDEMLSRQQPEGWFPEIGGMDLGYCSVLLDYAMIYTHITGDTVTVPAMRRLFNFMLPHLHPDATIDPQSGICLNPYVSRLGTGLLSNYDDKAASFVKLLRQFTPGQNGLLSNLADDLRFCRWSHLPLVTFLLENSFTTHIETIDHFYPQGWTLRKDSLLASYHKNNIHIFFSAAGGGSIYLYQERHQIGSEFSVTIKDYNKSWTTNGYDTKRKIKLTNNSLLFSTSLTKANYYFPGFLSRLALRLGCVFPWSSRLLRFIIDQIRLNSRSAINQSAAPVSNEKTIYNLTRTLKISPKVITIIDQIDGPDVNRKAILWHRNEANPPTEIRRDKKFNRSTIRYKVIK